MKNRQIDKKKSKQVRIDQELHQLAKLLAVKRKESLKTLTESALEKLIEEEDLHK